MSFFTKEDSYATIDCRDCKFTVVVVHNHDGDNQQPQYGPPKEVLDQDLPWF